VERTCSDVAANGPPGNLSFYTRPAYALETADLYYPPWLTGTWEVLSSTRGIIAPLGTGFFGSPGAYERAMATLNDPPLSYRARFSPSAEADGSCICERAFTVASISRAAMGANAVLGVGGPSTGFLLEGVQSADALEVRIRPNGADGRVFRAQLEVIGRTSRRTGDNSFECAELTRQTVFAEPVGTNSPAGQQQPGARPPSRAPPPPLVKEIETVSTYQLQPSGRVLGQQRTLTFLVADSAYTSNTDYDALRRSRAAGRYGVDGRVYDLVYDKAR